MIEQAIDICFVKIYVLDLPETKQPKLAVSNKNIEYQNGGLKDE